MKKRLDLLLAERGLATSRTQAAALILEGRVRVAGQVETKASRQVDAETAVAVEKPPRFVSRGGEKLQGAFDLWGESGALGDRALPCGDESGALGDRALPCGGESGALGDRALPRGGESGALGDRALPRGDESGALGDRALPVGDESGALGDRALPAVGADHRAARARLTVSGCICLDVGSSTGGFTDCLLQHGAKRVMAVDVGTNQLAYKLRSDPRVWVRENFNARYMKPSDLPEVPSVAVTDVSFISLKLILPPIAEVLAPGGLIVALIKPQFEVGKGKAPGGLVRDETLRLAACDGIAAFAKGTLGLELLGLAESPILGKEMGNVEYLSFWRKPPGAAAGQVR